jgi:hypothetical protein
MSDAERLLRAKVAHLERTLRVRENENRVLRQRIRDLEPPVRQVNEHRQLERLQNGRNE